VSGPTEKLATQWDVDSRLERTPSAVDDEKQHFGRYLLCYELAAGGMGTVFLARAIGPAGFDRPVAIKRIHPHLQHQRELVDMFLDEARLTSRINHPNVCAVHDFGEVEGTYYIALEYLMGESVSTVMATLCRSARQLETPRWQAIAARIIAGACEGLHAAHTLKDEAGRPLNVVHRDVSPHNLFVTYDGAVKLLDFGVARAEDRLHQTVDGTVKGKYAYMAPEQTFGKDVDARADVWSLGVCLWEMLTGERLFREKNEMQTLLAVQSKTIRKPSAVRASVPEELDAIVMRALRRNPEARYETARALGRDLHEVLRRHPEPTGLADVSEWMDAHFRARASVKAKMVKTVLASSSRLRTAKTREELRHESRAVREARLRAPREGSATPSLAPPSREGTATPSLPSREGTATPSLAPPSREVAPLRPTSADAPPKRRLGMAVAFGAVIVAAVIAVTVTGDEPALPPPPRLSTQGTTPVAAGEVGVAPESGETGSAERAQERAQVERPLAERALERAPEEPSIAEGPEEQELAEHEELAELEESPLETSRMRPRRRPRMAARAATQGSGHVQVATLGAWADIYVRGQRVNRTPRRIALPAGQHVIELRPMGMAPGVRKRVTVRAGRTTRLSHDFR